MPRCCYELLDAVSNDNASGEYYLTDIVGLARDRGKSATVVICPQEETLGVDSRAGLAKAEALFQARMRDQLLEDGVTLTAPETIHLAHDTVIGRDVEIEPNVVFGPGVTIETGAKIRAFCHLEGCHVSRGAVVGPYARLRPGAELSEDTRVGNFVEVKNALIAEGAKVNHLSYIGDASIGTRTNVGAGTITCNYDGFMKHRTEIGADSFIGFEHDAGRACAHRQRCHDGDRLGHHPQCRGRRAGAGPRQAGHQARPGNQTFRYSQGPQGEARQGADIMCGIVGVLGDHEVAPMLVEALKRLEYRGYDSAGIATVNDGRLDRRRAVGKLINLSDVLVHNPLPGKSGIGHTRWATHGAPSEDNAHPHRAGKVAVVHNGIIENFRELRADLAEKGIAFSTDTDTETVALLANHYLSEGDDPVRAAFRTIDQLEGAYALAFLFDGMEDLIVAARKGSPLALGWGDGEMFVGSDAIALSPMTDRITYLEEGDRAVVTRGGAEIFDDAGNRVNRAVHHVDASDGQVEKGGHKHWMSKEIAEQPAVLTNVLDHYFPKDTLTFRDGDLDFSDVERVVMVACGTGFYSCLVAKYWMEKLSGLPVEIDIASEFRYREPPLSPRTLAVFVSQSGETADTLAAMRYAAGKCRIVSLVNVAESSIAREPDLALPILAGREISVASTKAFTCQLAVLAAMSLKAGMDTGKLTPDQLTANIRALRSLPPLISHALSLGPQIAALSQPLSEAQDILFLGRGPMYPLALEGALKLKELSYIHAEGYASGELKHGPIALIDSHVPVIVMAPSDGLFDKTVSNMQEVMARGGKVLLVTDAKGAESARADCWGVLRMPDVDPLFAPILYAIPAQLIAYHTAIAKGTDVDQPRNLAKSVTVE